MSPVVLLGPQRYRPTVADAFRHVEAQAPVAAITAGWEEREGEIDELTEHLGCEVKNLRLYERAEHIFQRDPEFLKAWRDRRRGQREARGLHRVRLQHALEAARTLAARPPTKLATGQLEEALEAVRTLDRDRLAFLEQVEADFDGALDPAGRESIALHRRGVAETVAGCGTVAIAGGHVGVLRNRLRLFGVADLLAERPVLAWSAGAMCMTERVVAYHDNAPQGRMDPIVLAAGLGVVRGIVALPHAARRLDLDDAMRVGLFARRFAPLTCVALDDASGLIFDGDGWELFGDGARRLRIDGSVTPLRPVDEAA